MNETPSLHTLAEQVIEEALRGGRRLVTAESCTAGALSTLLADIPGAGDVLEGGFVSYAKSFKEHVLGVDAVRLSAESAVSESVALMMAQGALQAASKADVAIAITGVCGPKSDEDGNPVGLGYIAVADRSGHSRREKLELIPQSGGRVRGDMIAAGLRLLLEFLRDGR